MRATRAIWSILVPFCLALAVAAVVVMIRANTKAAAAPASTSPSVTMEKILFLPATVTVHKGATVLFDNKDVAPHTVTADDGSSDSGVIDPGKAYKLVANKAFTYHCTIHPSMKAAIRLEG
jgi:plastocyanin